MRIGNWKRLNRVPAIRGSCLPGACGECGCKLLGTEWPPYRQETAGLDYEGRLKGPGRRDLQRSDPDDLSQARRFESSLREVPYGKCDRRPGEIRSFPRHQIEKGDIRIRFRFQAG